MSRSSLAAAALLLVALVAGAATGVWLMRPSEPGAPAPSAVGGPFRLAAHDGRMMADTDLRGRPFLIFFGFTHCPDVCPATLFEVSEMLVALGADADRTTALFVTVDPARDTPEKLKDYLSSFHPRILGLAGDAAATEAIMRAYRVYARKVPLENNDYTMDHTATVYLMDREGRFVAPFNLKRPPEAAAADLRRYL